jgi:hypothetical protein
MIFRALVEVGVASIHGWCDALIPFAKRPPVALIIRIGSYRDILR